MRIALGIEYDGSCYHGWQKQPGLQTVQAHLEDALSHVANHVVTVTCAGRTDTGVHATGQVIHLDTTAERSERSWIFGANHHLPKNISVIWMKLVAQEFHARFSAEARRYRYIIYNHALRPAMLRTAVTWHFRYLEIERMQQAANCLIGEHDFTSFRALECQSRSAVRRLFNIDVQRQGDIVFIDIKANAFLHHMVRNIVGVLLIIGSGHKEVMWAEEVLRARNRSIAGMTAPPYGLYLCEVYYPEKFSIPLPRSKPLLF